MIATYKFRSVGIDWAFQVFQAYVSKQTPVSHNVIFDTRIQTKG